VTHQILDLFAGVGGLSLGFELLRDKKGEKLFSLHRAVEINKYACETLRSRHGDEKVIEGDLTKKSIHKKVVQDCKGKVSVVVGGIPCQSFSLIGPRSGFGKNIEKFKNDKRDFLYREFKKIVKEVNPNILIIENVKGILSKKDSKGKKIIYKIISDFEKIGYNFENELGDKYYLLNAADFGVPQKRERVVLIGIKKDWKDIKVPVIKPTHYDPSSEFADGIIRKGLLPCVTLGEAIGDLPKVKPKITYTGLNDSEKDKVREKNEKIDNGLDRIRINKKSFSSYVKGLNRSAQQYFHHIRPNGYKFVDHHVARSQQISDLQLFDLMKPGETAKDFLDRMPEKADKLIKYSMNSFMDKYRRQNSSEPATTIFAHLEKDGNRFIHPNQTRTITPREAARLQSFPDSFTFSGPMSKKFKQIGNAVPPLLSLNIAKAVQPILEK